MSIELGERYGLTHTPDELVTVLAERQTTDTELDDTQLESASGGNPISIATQASKAQVQQELSRFR